jgi:hypothetical protein
MIKYRFLTQRRLSSMRWGMTAVVRFESED